MTKIQQQAEELLQEWTMCKNARSKGDAVNLQIEKDALERWANQLSRALTWAPDDVHTVETLYQFEHRLRVYKDKIIIEILKHGSV